jgi:hypothetical protein
VRGRIVLLLYFSVKRTTHMAGTKVGHAMASVGLYTDVDTTARNVVGTRSMDDVGNEYVYMKGVASCLAGSWVYFDELFLTVLTVANSLGAIAIAQAPILAANWGWFAIYGAHQGLCLASYADNAKVWCTSTAGSVDDADVAVDLITGAIGRSARNTTTGMALFQLSYPFAHNEVVN